MIMTAGDLVWMIMAVEKGTWWWLSAAVLILKLDAFSQIYDDDENVSRIIYADRDDNADVTTNRYLVGLCQIRNVYIFSARWNFTSEATPL